MHYDVQSINPLPADKQIFINSSLLPLAVGFWENALLLRPSHAPIRLSRKCVGNHYFMDESDLYPSCADRCRTHTTCGEVIVPADHLLQCRTCPLPNPLSCVFSGHSTGTGILNADFLLYVSVVESQRCKNEDTIAYAAHCQQEAELDRPIAGHVNICPNALSTHSHDLEILVSTIKHEILHALGFSAGLYAFFRDENGRPRTPRNRHNRPISFNREKGYYDASNAVVKTVIRDWWTADGMIEHPVHLMVTERVRKEARRHFNCSELDGAELENQGGEGTALTHWEKRVFENEAMTGTHTQNPVYSRVTLALMEDTGWYKANYSIAESLHWGRDLGCQFAMKSCGDWIRTRHKNNESVAPFCSDIKHDGHRSLATTKCTDQRDSLALCNLVPYKSPLVPEYRNFVHLKGVRQEGLYHYGGSVEIADFCPYNQEFEWKAVNFTDRRDSRCELETNVPDGSNAIMEVYGHGSRCFDLAISWTERKCGRARIYSQFMAGCYAAFCVNGRLYLRVFNSTKLYPCYKENQLINIHQIVDGWLREGSILCPSCEDICPTNSSHWLTDLELTSKGHLEFSTDFDKRNYPKARNRILKECLPPPKMELDGYGSIDDPPLSEPCSALSLVQMSPLSKLLCSSLIMVLFTQALSLNLFVILKNIVHSSDFLI